MRIPNSPTMPSPHNVRTRETPINIRLVSLHRELTNWRENEDRDLPCRTHGGPFRRRLTLVPKWLFFFVSSCCSGETHCSYQSLFCWAFQHVMRLMARLGQPIDVPVGILALSPCCTKGPAFWESGTLVAHPMP